jgi:hypothetical protein
MAITAGRAASPSNNEEHDMNWIGTLSLAIGVAALLVTFLPFSPLTIDLVNLSRDRQIRIHRQRKRLWAIAGAAFVVALLVGLAAARAGAPLLLYATLAAGAGLAMMFWTGYVPVVMTPPGSARHLAGAAAEQAIDGDEIILGVSVGDAATAYRRDQIARPHYFNDTVGDRDLMISYCILCNSATAFEPMLNGQKLTLECVTAFDNNIIYYDPASANYIQQLSAEVIDGPARGQTLSMYPVVVARWRDWHALHPASVLYDAPPRGVRDRLVGLMLQLMIPISRLSQRDRPWHRVSGVLDQRLRAMAFVLGVDINGEAVGYPLDGVGAQAVINDDVGGSAIAVFHDQARDVAAVFSRSCAGQVLEFAALTEAPGIATDSATGSRWDVTGLAIAGDLVGQRLTGVAHFNKLFWFSWALFKPSTRLHHAT